MDWLSLGIGVGIGVVVAVIALLVYRASNKKKLVYAQEEAKRLLLSTSMSVSEIASYVGYFNISYFSTVFHKIVGVSPFDWRNEGGNEHEAK